MVSFEKHSRLAVLVAGTGLAAGLGLVAAAGAAHAGISASAQAAITLPAQTGAVTVDQGTNVAYIAGTPDGGLAGVGVVYAVRVSDGRVLATIPDSTDHPSSMAINPASGTLYVGSDEGSTISVISTATARMTARILLPHRDMAFSLAVDVAARKVFIGVGNGTDNAAIAVVNPARNSITSTIAGLQGNAASAMVLDAAHQVLYAGTTHTIYAINAGTGSVARSFAGDEFPVAMALNGGALYVNYAMGIDARYDIASDAMTGSYTYYPLGPSFALNPANGLPYVLGFGPRGEWAINQLNRASTAMTGYIPVPAYGPMALDQAASTLVYAAVYADTNNGATIGVLFFHLSATTGFTSAPAATFTTGKAGSYTARASGTPKAIFSETGRLPAGVTFFRAGVLSGTPRTGTGGVYRIVLSASNGLGSPVIQSFTLTVTQPAAITSANHATFIHGRNGTFTIRTTGYPAATVGESGTLPPGLRFTPGPNGTGTISGTPARSAAGKTYIIRLTATNRVGTVAAQRFTLTVS